MGKPSFQGRVMKISSPVLIGLINTGIFVILRGPPQARKFFSRRPGQWCLGANLWFFGTRETAQCLELAAGYPWAGLPNSKASDWWNASFYAFRSRSHYLWVRQWVRDTLLCSSCTVVNHDWICPESCTLSLRLSLFIRQIQALA